MALGKQEFFDYIKQFKFRELFNDMGWDNDKTRQPITVDNETCNLEAVAQKSGFKILILQKDAIPVYAMRRKIEAKVTKLFQEHLIIFFDEQRTKQIWQLAVRQAGKPTKLTETSWKKEQAPELLYQRLEGAFFEMDEEEHITIVDVKKRIADNFQQNNEKVTKKFYDGFKKEHDLFRNFIEGISEKIDKEWYASLMLNRLMFCYFIQKKGFLDKNKNYLRDKLNACKEKKGKVKFYSFYRSFLLILFHKGLNNPERPDEIQIEIGKVPYLNGGLFDEHELEKNNAGIDIDDKAFETLFDFFDQYEWHLDTRATALGNEINPDVIGYIFEKYINDRANMGAYYTKEDITDYIGKNCIIPYLFDEAKRNYGKAFAIDGDMWLMAKQSGDDYIYDAVKKGAGLPLPAEIETGIDAALPNLRERRKEWNKPAASEYALPTEIWRETIARRQRYCEAKAKIESGEISSINDFITYNLNIRQFAQDAVENTNDPEFLKAFYKALKSVTILDPTCGSGAFLFAAMNILEPLYEACIMRMRAFAEEESHKHKFFREVLENIQSPQHPNLQYFIYKNIILNNLYGVDIMKEAAEIAKLRLFLKLVATVEADYKKPNLGLEPLPDIDFNIRTGNTLVGYATEAELDKALASSFNFDNDKEKIKENCDIVAKAFKHYKEIQLTYGNDFEDFKNAKEDMNNRLKMLNKELNLLLHKQAGSIPYETWLQTYQPFHWFAEFYEIIQGNGGFDVIIGNPPYVVYKKKDSKTKISAYDKYKLKDYTTLQSDNLYSFCIERSYQISKEKSRIGMIIPISSVSSNKFLSLQKIFASKLLTWQSNFSNRPSKLFEDVEQRLTIFVSEKLSNTQNLYYSCNYQHWYANTRDFLFLNLIFAANILSELEISFSKVGLKIESQVKEKLLKKSNRTLGLYITTSSNYFLYYHNGPTYFIRAMSFMPNSESDMQPSSHYKKILYDSELLNLPICILNSSIFYFFYKNYSNCRDFSEREINAFPIGNISKENIEQLHAIEKQLKKSYKENSELKNRKYGSGLIYYEEFYPAKSKFIIDEIDRILAEHYGFTEEELDFIINYDIKYRMGRELEEDAE